ncbi:group 1 glycosyl transferase [Clostridium bornimense]|uniref:Group 1 glycosyl transferase n=1 Tax=Clostridium bornimense TaxID=1216932 RepID=W6RUD6_9CLOT|nr:glycosyltransferase family 4 protein [Clostridium bornimense]CDM68251.1 group 1 glycosyl transferase [Clostridium bornimense]
MKKFVLYSSGICNEVFTKDICLIPFVMQKYYGYESSILTYTKEQNFPDNDKYLGHMKITSIENDEHLDRELESSDVIMMFGIYDDVIDLIYRYKRLNENGKIYLKLDINSYWLNSLHVNMNNYIMGALKKCDLITAENRNSQEFINNNWGVRVEYIPNGYYEFVSDDYINYKEKKNVILFVGRVGSPDKANHILLEAFARIENEIEDWSIELVGNVDPGFMGYINEYYYNNPKRRERVRLVGFLGKKELKEKYKQSKIFCLTSPSEACANVFSQAISNGCYLISTDVDGARDITNNEEFGCIVPVYDIDRLSIALKETCLNEKLLEENCIVAQKYAKESLNWIKLCDKINNFLFHKSS